MMAPDEEPDAGDRDHRIHHEVVAEDPPSREAGNDLRDHAHRREHHDVDRRMRVEPEQMLEQHRVAAVRGIEDRQSQPPLRDHKQQRNRQYGRRENHDDRRGIDRPHEQRQTKPGHARRTQHVSRGNEVDAGRDAGKARRRRRRLRRQVRGCWRTSSSKGYRKSSRYRRLLRQAHRR